MQKVFDFTLSEKNPNLLDNITMDKIHGWMQRHGEDWVDYHESIVPGEEFYKFVTAKRPVIKYQLDENLGDENTDRYGLSVQDIQSFYEEFYDDEQAYKREDHLQAWHIFYTDYIEFVNTDNKYKVAINEALLEDNED